MKIIKHLIIFLTLLLTTSCSYIMLEKTAIPQKTIVYPDAPVKPRIQYLKTFNNSSDVMGKQSKFNRFIFGDLPAYPIQKPFGIDISPNGRLFVCDNNGIKIFNLESNVFEFFNPSGLGKLRKPINCYIDDTETLYVADRDRAQIIIFDSLLQYVNVIQDIDTNKFYPADIQCNKDKIFVMNVFKHKVYVYDKKTLAHLYSFPDADPGDEEYIYTGLNLCVNNDNVYVSDFGSQQVKVYSLSGKYIRVIGGIGDYPGRFVRPKGLSIDSNNILYVVDAAFENVQLFDSNGRVLMHIGGPYKESGDMWLPVDVSIDYDNIKYFKQYVAPEFDLKYLIIVSNQYGPDKINVYGFITPKQP